MGKRAGQGGARGEEVIGRRPTQLGLGEEVLEERREEELEGGGRAPDSSGPTSCGRGRRLRGEREAAGEEAGERVGAEE